jgi:hypothetical protein
MGLNYELDGLNNNLWVMVLGKGLRGIDYDCKDL